MKSWKKQVVLALMVFVVGTAVGSHSQFAPSLSPVYKFFSDIKIEGSSLFGDVNNYAVPAPAAPTSATSTPQASLIPQPLPETAITPEVTVAEKPSSPKRRNRVSTNPSEGEGTEDGECELDDGETFINRDEIDEAKYIPMPSATPYTIRAVSQPIVIGTPVRQDTVIRVNGISVRQNSGITINGKPATQNSGIVIIK